MVGKASTAAAVAKHPELDLENSAETRHIDALGNVLVCPEERAHVHDDPERRALAQPRHNVAARAGGAGTSRLAHDARVRATNRTCGTR
jgi:hypothetical protein